MNSFTTLIDVEPAPGLPVRVALSPDGDILGMFDLGASGAPPLPYPSRSPILVRAASLALREWSASTTEG